MFECVGMSHSVLYKQNDVRLVFINNTSKRRIMLCFLYNHDRLEVEIFS